MKKSLIRCALVLAAAQFLAGAAEHTKTFRWIGGKMTDTEYLIRRSNPKDSVVHDVYMTCKRGDADIRVNFVTSPLGGYTNEELAKDGKRLPQKAVFFVDYKRVDEIDVLLGQDEAFADNEYGINVELEMTRSDALFKAMQKGKTLRFELPRAKSHVIPLGPFASMARAMVSHCKL